MAGQPAPQPAVKATLYRDGQLYFGTADARGEFLPSGDLERQDGLAPLISDSRLCNRRLLNPVHATSGPVYEYRSGRLVPGSFDEDGYFIPELGGTTIAFDQYVPGPTARPIYNLPSRQPTDDRGGPWLQPRGAAAADP